MDPQGSKVPRGRRPTQEDQDRLETLAYPVIKDCKDSLDPGGLLDWKLMLGKRVSQDSMEVQDFLVEKDSKETKGHQATGGPAV